MERAAPSEQDRQVSPDRHSHVGTTLNKEQTTKDYITQLSFFHCSVGLGYEFLQRQNSKKAFTHFVSMIKSSSRTEKSINMIMLSAGTELMCELSVFIDSAGQDSAQ